MGRLFSERILVRRSCALGAAVLFVVSLLLLLITLAVPALTQAATPAPDPGVPLPYVIGLHEAYLTPDYWAARLDNADAPILDRAQIQAQNARMRTQDPHIQDIAALPAALPAAQPADFSRRRSGFPRIIQHDILGSSRVTGGPLLDLQGRCIGMNIARANRAESFAIPVEELREIAERLIELSTTGPK